MINIFLKILFLKDGNNLIEEEELDGFVKDLMDLVRKVFKFQIMFFIYLILLGV